MTTILDTQLRAALWPFEGARVHAIVDATALPALPLALAAADCAGWDCLQRGALAPEEARRAAYIVELDPDASFTHWLLQEMCSVFDNWGVLTTSRQPLLAMREHSRDLAELRMPGGLRRAWRWWDHDLLDLLLPSLSPPQLDAVFAPGQQLVCPGRLHWTWWQRLDGLLDRREQIFA